MREESPSLPTRAPHNLAMAATVRLWQAGKDWVTDDPAVLRRLADGLRALPADRPLPLAGADPRVRARTPGDGRPRRAPLTALRGGGRVRRRGAPVTVGRRAVVLRRPECDSGRIEQLSRAHGLRVVYTVYTDTGPELAARIAVQHVLDHDAEAVVIPYLSAREAGEGRAWRMVAWFADLVTANGVVEGRFSEVPRGRDRRDSERPP